MIQEQFLSKLSPEQRELFLNMDTPAKIQTFLNKTPYSIEEINRCPVSVLRDGVAHCLDGGLLAAAALRQLGYPPVLLDLQPEPFTDDDHVLAIYRVDGYYGCLAKSNYVGLRSREAVYRTIRELVLSYFEDFFSVQHEKTLRYYTTPLYLKRYDRLNWMTSDQGADAIEDLLAKQRRITLLTPQMIARLAPVDEIEYKAGTLITDPRGTYKPKKRATVIE